MNDKTNSILGKNKKGVIYLVKRKKTVIHEESNLGTSVSMEYVLPTKPNETYVGF